MELKPNIPVKKIVCTDTVTVELDEIKTGIFREKRRIKIKIPRWDLERALKQYANKKPIVL